LYYHAPICAVMNLIVAMITEISSFALSDVSRAGVLVLLLNTSIIFLLNLSSVFL
ncbi:hypothetical protein BJ878DRAFT_391160, partial [Calycina marina]